MGIPPKNNQESKNKKGDTSEGFFSNFMGNIKKSFSDKKSSVSGLFSGSMSKLFNEKLNFKKNISSNKNDKNNEPKTGIDFLDNLFHFFQISDYFEKNYQKKTKKIKKILEAISKNILPIIGDIQSKLEDYSFLKKDNSEVTSFLSIILEFFKFFKKDEDIPKLKDILKTSIIFKTIRRILGSEIKKMLNVFEDLIQRFKDISVTSFLCDILEFFKKNEDIPKLKDILKTSIIFKTIRRIIGSDIKKMLNVFEDLIQRFKNIDIKKIKLFSDCFLSFINKLANSSKNGLLLIVGIRGFDAVDKSCDKIILIFKKINKFLKNIDIKKISNNLKSFSEFFLKITNELLPSIKSSIDEFIFLGKKLNDKKLSQIFFGADRILNLLKVLFEKITKFTNETKKSNISKNIEIFSDCFLSFINKLANSSKNGLLLIVGMRGFDAVDKSCDKIILIFEKINESLKNIDIKKISNHLKSFSEFFFEFTNYLYKSSLKGFLINHLGLLNIFVSISLITKIIKIVSSNNSNINKSHITFLKLAKISKNLGIIAISLAVASWVSLLINPIGLLLLFSVLIITSEIFNLLSIIAGKNIKESCKNLLFISLTLFLFSVSIAFSVAIMSKVPIMFFLMLIGVILAITGILFLLSKLQKDVARGALSIIIIGIAMLIMSYALMVFYKATKDMTVEQAIIGMSIIALYTLGTILIAKSLQKNSMSIENLGFATATMILTSISLLIASKGLLVFYHATKNMTIEKALIGATVIGIFVGGVIGISFLLKKGAVSMKDIAAANGVLMMVSISLLISSKGLLVFYHATKNLELKSAAIGVGIVLAFFGMMVAIAALTMVVSWAGVVAAGAALVLMSTSILIAANGIKVLAEIKWPDEKSNKKMTSFGVAMLEFMMSLVPLSLVSIFLIPASLTLYTVGHSLVSFSKNLNESMNILNWSTAEKKLKDISNVITGITAAFASVAFSGGIGGVLTGIFKTLTLGLGKNSAEQGADAVKASGKALIEITDGIIHFSNLTKNLNFDINDKNSITNRICTVLTAVSSVFSSIGMTAIPKGIWGLISGNDVNFVERGINSCKNMGNVLNSLADGISAWMELPEGMDIETISKNIKTVLDTVSKSFSSIGMTAIPKGIWGLISGDNVNFVERGINSCKNMGNVLNSLANGISAWMELPEGMDVQKISWNIKHVLNIISGAFTSIGMTAIPTGIWGFISGDDVNFVERGINSCKNMGSVL
ncbi:MAG: hypothetical protein PHV15_13245, partial [Thomasclavelia ramosa]|nr:hypothetical protein [Thomasclavelia ramosa]